MPAVVQWQGGHKPYMQVGATNGTSKALHVATGSWLGLTLWATVYYKQDKASGHRP